jgi:hypothetical protein
VTAAIINIGVLGINIAIVVSRNNRKIRPPGKLPGPPSHRARRCAPRTVLFEIDKN